MFLGGYIHWFVGKFQCWVLNTFRQGYLSPYIMNFKALPQHNHTLISLSKLQHEKNNNNSKKE